MVSPFPSPQGLYTGTDEHDACGVGLVANLSGEATRAIVEQAITVLVNLDHRGASGSDPDSGDGAGILIQVPDEFLRAFVTFDLPTAGSYAVGMAFFENDDAQQEATLFAIVRC